MPDALSGALLDLCRLRRSGKLAAPTRDALAEGGARTELFALAAEHRVLAYALSSLQGWGGFQELPEETRAAIEEVLAPFRARAVLWALERDRLLQRLQREGIHPVVLKGAALAETVYGGAHERTFNDLDLLLPEDQLDGAVDLLLSAGYRNPWTETQWRNYRERHFHLPLEHPNGFYVELHWGLLRAEMPFELDPRAFLAESISVERGRQLMLRIPRPEHMLLHIASQNLEKVFSRLNRIVDIDRVLDRYGDSLDWEYLAARAREWRLAGVLGFTLQLSRRLLDTYLPPGALEQLTPGGLARAHLGLLRPTSSLLARRFDHSAVAGNLLLLWLFAEATGYRRYFAKLLVDGDPLLLSWSRDEGEPKRRFMAGPLAVGKLAVYQTGVYASGAAAALTPAGRAELAFW